MKKTSSHKTQYRLIWHKIVLFTVAIVLTGIYSITAKGQTAVPLSVNASSIATSISAESEENVFSADTTSISLGYGSGSSDTVNITSNTNWYALITYYNDYSSWLDLSTDSGSNSGTIILMTNSTNTGSYDRTATVTISSTGFADKVIIVKQVYQPHILGNMYVYRLTDTTAYRKAMPIIFYESGEIQSISIYHNGGTGNVLLGVYLDLNDRVSSLIGVTASTPINTNAGWQTVSLESPVKVASGQQVWLAWVFENNPGVRFTTWVPGHAEALGNDPWSAGLPTPFVTENEMFYIDYIYSVYCTYMPTPDLIVSPTSIPLGYSSKSEGTFNITSNTTWTITDYPDWLDVSQRSGSNYGIITLKAISSNTGTSRNGTVTIAGTGVEDKTILITQEYQPNTLGNIDVNNNALSSDQSAYRKAQPITAYESGEIESVSIYHNGGTGNVLLGVYSDQAGKPVSLLGVTAPTPINSEAGWQTVPLTNPVIVTSGQTVWLSWVFEDNPGVRYTKELHSVAESAESWPAGMPITFGTMTYADFKYSVYCSYKPDKAIPTLTISQSKISLDNYHGASATFNITSNSSWNIVVDSNWMNGLNVSPVSGTNNGTITLTNSQFLGRSRTATVYIYCTGTELFRILEVTSPSYLEHLGSIDLFTGYLPTSIPKTQHRQAQPVTFNESVKIESITLSHNGGQGNVILGVYSDHAGSPSLLLGETAPTAVSIFNGMQHVSLISPVTVFRGQTVWLSWVFEDNPGVKYIEGFPSGVESTDTWSAGIPSTFGTANATDFKYAIYCSYRRDAAFPYLTVSEPHISLGSDFGSSESINIESNTGWSITINASWLNVSPENGSGNKSITFTANSPNTETSSRTATVLISCPGFTKKTIIVTQESQAQNSKILGNKEVYSLISTLPYRKAQPISIYESGVIDSLFIYHNGGTGNVLLGVYSDQAGSPSTLLGVTTTTPIHTEEGWQAVPLLSPLAVVPGQTVWLSWVFENCPGVRYTPGIPGRVKSMETWSAGMPITFGATTYADYTYSVYCTYKPVDTTPSLTVSTENISLGYDSGSSGTFNIASNTDWNITDDVGWLDVLPASGSNNAVISLTANSVNTGTSPRTATITISGAGVADKTLTVTQAYRINTLGNTDIYSLISTLPYRKAQPVTFIESGEIESISVYHNGGTGSVLMGVYSDQEGSPSSLLGVTATTPINTAEGWQTVPLTSPVAVSSGQTVWLSWVFDNNPGVRYTSGTPGRVKSAETWSAGMPAAFGTGSYADYIYSVYCTYSPSNDPDYQNPGSFALDTTSFTSVNLNKNELLIFPNPTTGNIIVKWNSSIHERTILSVYDALGQAVRKVHSEPGIKEIQVDLSDVQKGMYLIELKESSNGMILNRSKIVRN